ncbi:unnamed protein product [Sphagnum jensenii]|uniref:Collagen-like protein n=1 Tax=Sphagnum jensenii TaxID=128206 RepID=A0ABP0VHI8_9BRYO
MGSIGRMGSTGILPGAQGSQGAQGPQGASGPQGLAGIPGLVGAQGLGGVSGLVGTQGPQGLIGVCGGNTGSQGAQGFTGPQGAQGIGGLSGSQGPQGPSGRTTTNLEARYTSLSFLSTQQYAPSTTFSVAFGTTDYDNLSGNGYFTRTPSASNSNLGDYWTINKPGVYAVTSIYSQDQMDGAIWLDVNSTETYYFNTEPALADLLAISLPFGTTAPKTMSP